MKFKGISIALFVLILSGQSLVRGQEMDTKISTLATNLATAINSADKKKVAVIDFTDLEGNSNELGKYVAEQLTVDLVIAKHDFSVLDRGNLRKILAEHKLSATGLVDPENAKMLGHFAGVDAIILGTVTPKKENVSVTAKIITTDTAEIVGAAKAQFQTDDTIKQLAAKDTSDSSKDSGNQSDNDKPKVSKTIGDLRVELSSLKMVDSRQLLLTMNLVNLNTNRSIFIALNGDMMNTPHAALHDDGGAEFGSGPYDRGVSGIPSIMYSQYGYQGPGFSKAVEIRPGDSIIAIVKFFPVNGHIAEPKLYSVQMEFIISYDFSNGHGQGTVNNFSAKIKAE